IGGAIPSGVPLQAAEAVKDTLGGALEVAQRLPDQIGPQLVDAARTAFTRGLHVSAAISAIGAIALAILVMTLLRRVRTGSESWEEPERDSTGRSAAGDGLDTVVAPTTSES
ncbi:MAG: hypothetical protein M3135_00810, partial [Actinomycetota bacterium]|nr:hypothetical protein [Actinomycetota bacterium]